MRHGFTRFPVRWLSLGLIVALLFVQAPPALAADTLYLPVIQSQTAAVSAASLSAVTALVRLAPGVDVSQVSADYQATVLRALPTLSVYRLQSHNPYLVDTLARDPRVLSAEADDQFVAVEAQQHVFDGTGSDFQALQRYFGSGSGDAAALQKMIEKAAKKARKKKSFVNPLEQVLVTPAGQVLDAKWQTWGGRGVHLEKALKRYTGAGITVAVLDTGVALNHPALATHLAAGYDFVENDPFPEDTPNGLDEDADGLFDEGAGHGTHIAGVIAAVAPQARILPVRVLNSDGGGTLFAIVQGLLFAVDQGAQVINLSLSTVSNSPVLEAAIRYALDRQVLVIAAASGDETGLDYPAAYERVIAVGAIREDNNVTAYSAPYASMVDVFAPGDYIYSAYYDGNFAWWSGTSMAAPFVAGGAALLLSSGACSSACTQDLLMDKVDPVSKILKGIGRINLDKATKAVH